MYALTDSGPGQLRLRTASRGGGIVTAAGLNLVIPIVYPDLDLAEGTVVLGVGRRVAKEVLRAEFFGNLLEASRCLARLVNPDYTATRLAAEFL